MGGRLDDCGDSLLVAASVEQTSAVVTLNRVEYAAVDNQAPCFGMRLDRVRQCEII